MWTNGKAIADKRKPMKLLKKSNTKEEPLEDIQFNIYKFNNRPKPADRRQILVIGCFSEFGCETVGVLYCLPRILQQYPGKYKIVMGWYGRDYLYKHLVDEFWEIKEEHQHLREHCRAFHHESKNLAKIEKSASEHGIVMPSDHMGRIAIGAKCNHPSCNHFWISVKHEDKCPKCSHKNVRQSVFGDIAYYKKQALRVPVPCDEKMELVKKYLKPKSVGIFARGRKCYGRNLQPEFYVKLISLLQSMGYNPIWLGEKQSTQPCPVDHIIDFSRMDESRDLETTLAIVKQLEFTVQFWTASTRLAGMMGVPYLLFESPDQIWGRGQEGYRRNLCDFGPRKLSVNHFWSVYEDNDAALEVVKQCINEMEEGNYEDHIGLVESRMVVESMMNDNKDRIGGNIV
jgi:hypothetical protein